MGEWHLLKGSWLVPSCCEQFTEDRCFRAGGFIIRAKATIHTNGFIAFREGHTIRIKTRFLNKADSLSRISALK